MRRVGAGGEPHHVAVRAAIGEEELEIPAKVRRLRIIAELSAEVAVVQTLHGPAHRPARRRAHEQADGRRRPDNGADSARHFLDVNARVRRCNGHDELSPPRVSGDRTAWICVRSKRDRACGGRSVWRALGRSVAAHVRRRCWGASIRYVRVDDSLASRRRRRRYLDSGAPTVIRSGRSVKRKMFGRGGRDRQSLGAHTLLYNMLIKSL